MIKRNKKLTSILFQSKVLIEDIKRLLAYIMKELMETNILSIIMMTLLTYLTVIQKLDLFYILFLHNKQNDKRLS